MIAAPNEYTLPKIFGHHHKPPSPSMGLRLRGEELTRTPGPGAYPHQNFSKSFHRAPQFTVREKGTVIREENTPGPGSYCPEKVRLTHNFDCFTLSAIQF